MNKKEADYLYKDIEADFYDRQLNSLNPLRAWIHTNRYLIIDMLVKANYREKDKIADLGCGDCNWNTSLLPVHGVDVNESMLKFAYRKKRLVSFQVNNFCKTSLKDEEVDIVVASEVLEHQPEIGSLLKEVKRILKPQGKFILSVPYDTVFSLWRPLFSLQCLLHGYILRNDYYKNRCGHLQHFSPDSLCKVLGVNGLVVEDIFNMRRFTIFAVAHKERKQEMGLNCDELTILIPTLNEEKSIGQLLSSLVKKYLGVKIIVCDDSSKDRTREIVNNYPDKNILFLDRSKEKVHGLAVSVLDGINLVRTPYFVVIDADLQHPPEKIEGIYHILKLDYDIVIASRIMVPAWQIDRKIMSFIATLLGKIVLLLREKSNFSYDILSGFWGGNTDFIKKLIEKNRNKFQFRGYKILFDFLKIMPKDARIGEVFYAFKTRSGGESKISLSVIISFLKSLFL